MFLPLEPAEDALAILERVEESQVDELSKKCVHSVIVLGQDRAPIKRQELNRLAFLTTNYRVAGAILQVANKMLHDTFGMRLYETADRTKLILVNSKLEYQPLARHTEEACEDMAILYFILTDIFSSPNEQISEEEIERSLGPLELPADVLKEHLDNFVKKMYLQMGKNQEVKTFSWGPRAIAEVDPEEFFKNFLDLAGGDSATNWPDLGRRVESLKAQRNW